MRGVWWRVRAAVRRRWLATTGIAVAVAIVSEAVLTVAAGARRTANAPDAYTRSVGGDLTAQVQQASGQPRTAEIAALPGVRSVETITFVFAALIDRGTDDQQLLGFAGTRPPSARLVEGRAANPSDPHEFVSDESFVQRHHAHIGQRFQMVSWTADQAKKGLGFNAKPGGPSFEARLVGVYDTASRLEDDYSTITFSPALLRLDVGVVASIMAVRGKPGLTVARLRAEIDRLPGGASLEIDSGAVVSANIRNSVSAQALGTALMAAVLAIAALVALGQLLTRHVRAKDRDLDILRAIGFTRPQLVLERVARGALPAAAGIAGGIGLAVAASGRFPAGFVRALEPHPGTRFDALVLLGGGALLWLAMVGWAAIALTLSRHRRRRAASYDALARRAPTPTAVVGARFALTGRDATTRSVIGTFLALAAIMTGIVGSAVFAASLDRLVTDRGRFGGNYTVAIGENSGVTAPQLHRVLAGAPGVEGLMILTSGTARAGRATVGLVGVDPVQGDLRPHLLSGRLPIAPDEIAPGRVAAHDLHVSIGDHLRLAGGHRDTYRVVGTVVVPTIGGNDGVGQGAVVTAAGLARLQPQPDVTMAALRLAPGTSVRSWEQQLQAKAGTEDPPGVIVNVRRVRSVPSLLAALLAGLVLLTLFHALIVSIQSRRRDLAILRALGADGRWVGRAVHWQASVLTAVPLIAGIPIGLVAGSVAFRAFSGAIGAVPDPTLPLALIAASLVALVVVANAVAVVPSRRARGVATAALLKME